MRKKLTAFFMAFLMTLSSADMSVLAAPAAEESGAAANKGCDIAEAEGLDGNGIGAGSSGESVSGSNAVTVEDSTGGSEESGSGMEEDNDKESVSDTENPADETTEEETAGEETPEDGAAAEENPKDALPEEEEDEETSGKKKAPAGGKPAASLTETFLVDLTPPYDGDYLLAANTNADENGSKEPTGALPDVENAVERSYCEENVVSTAGENICGYDENGRGLIDPASFLPELTVDEGAAQYFADVAPAPETSYTEGGTKSFKLQTGNKEYTWVDCKCIAIGGYCTVWVPVDDPILAADAAKMQKYMKTLADEFDGQYPKMTEMFGSKKIADEIYGDNDGKTALLCYDIQGDGMSYGAYTAGYFWAADTSARYSNRTGNDLDCLHIDSWQGMTRNAGSNTLNPTYSKGTMVHELQHMINFSICREKERESGSTLNFITTPTYLNEAYSEAAPYLCYGSSYDKGRVSHYNSHLENYLVNGRVSLMDWGSVDTLCNYSLSYLFGQYIRTQYENGDTIYKDTMNALSPDSKDLMAIIADKLGVMQEEMLLNFRAALFLKNAEGPFGFKGEDWAEAINRAAALGLSGSNAELKPGAALVVSMDGDYTPSGEGGHIRFAGMNSKKTVESVRQVSLTRREEKFIGGVTVYYEAEAGAGGSVWVSYTLDGSDPTKESKSMPETGLTFDRAGVYRLKVLGYSSEEDYEDARDEMTVTVKQVEEPEISVEDQEGAEYETQEKIIGKKVTLTAPEGALVYYTTDGTAPSVTDKGGGIVVGTGTRRYTAPFVIDQAGTTTVKAVAVQYGAVSSGIAGQEFYVRFCLSELALNHTSAELYSNREAAERSLMLVPVIAPEEAADDVTLVWHSDDEKVAVVDEEGVVTAVSPGETVVSVSADGLTASCSVTVRAVIEAIAVDDSPPFVISSDGGTLDISRKVIYMPEGALREELLYQVEPSDRPGDKPGLASISEEGVLAAARDGVVKVTVSVRDRQDVETAVAYVTISGQTSVRLYETSEDILGGVRITRYALSPENAEIYYTTDGMEPTVDSRRWQDESVVVDTKGLHQFRFLGYDPSGRCTSVERNLTLYLAQLNAPDIQVDRAGSSARLVTITAQRDAEIYYTTDGTEPAVKNGSVQNGIRYTGQFSLDPAAGLPVKAIAVKAGAVTSPVEEYRFDSKIRITGLALDMNSAVLYSSQTKEDRTLVLTPEVTPSRAIEGLDLVWTSDRPDIAQVEMDESGRGIVTTVSPGEALVTVSAAELSAVCIVTVKARKTGQTVEVSRTREEVLGGVRMAYSVNRPAGAVVYYTTDASVPSAGDRVMPEQGVLLDIAGSHLLRIWANDPSGMYEDTSAAEQVVLGQCEEPVVKVEERAGGRYVTLTARGSVEIYYTTDGKDPYISGGAVRHGEKYTGPFLLEEGVSVVKAAAAQKGSVTSQTAVEDVVDRIHVMRITLDTESAVLYTDRTAQKSLALAPTIMPVGARETVLTWKSDHPEVAEVNGEGFVTAVSPGTARIFVSADSAVAVCTVTVRSDSGTSSGQQVRQGIEITVDGALHPYHNLPIETGKSYVYTGEAITPAVAVMNNGEPLMEGIDYTVKYANNVKVPAGNAGDAKRPKITITGKNNMMGKAILYFDIYPVDLNDTEGEYIVRTAKNSKASPVLCYNGNRLVLNRDYKTDCSPNMKWKENGYITFTGIGSYTGTRKFYVSVWGLEYMRKFTLKMDKSAKNISYDGYRHYPVFSVYDKQTGEELDESDYYVVYPEDLVSAGKKKITVAGKGFYSGCSATQSYTVKPCQDFSYIRINDSGVQEEYPFVRSGVTFQNDEIRITYLGRSLLEGKDYKIVYSKNKKIGTAKYSITFLGNYKGVKGLDGQTGTFTITKAELSGLNWQAVALDMVYKKPGIYKAKVYVSVDRVLLKSSDYTASYELSDGTEMKGGNKLDLSKVSGTVTVRIRGKGNYAGEGEIRTSYEVRPKEQGLIDLSKAKVTVVDDNTGTRLKSVQYDGTAKKPRVSIQVKDGRSYRELNQEEYAALEPHIVYVNNVNKGKSAVVVNGDGVLFTGSRSAAFTIAQRNLTAPKRNK